MEVFTIAYQKVIKAFEGQRYESLLDGSERSRADAFVHEADRLRFLAARYLVIWLREQKTGKVDLPLSFVYTSDGKPCLELNELLFNWSHSGEYISLATGMYPVGVDIECHREIERSAARYICSDEEWEKMNRLEGNAFLSDFYRLWTAKESLLKAKGIGLGVEPSLLKINFSETDGAVWQAALGQRWYGSSHTFNSGSHRYTVSFCSGERDARTSFQLLENLQARDGTTG